MAITHNIFKLGALSQRAGTARKRDWTAESIAAACKLGPATLAQAFEGLDLRLEIKRPAPGANASARHIWLRGYIEVLGPRGRYKAEEGADSENKRMHRLINLPLGYVTATAAEPADGSPLYIAAGHMLVDLQAARRDLAQFAEVLNQPLPGTAV